ncbi:MAG: YhcH/YjgK/YiaL family protein [Verrucomicrobia bacterium]|nr:YhcH/YjgK/YiaL family protein [Verrucomicrobiota bacterium]
MIIDSLAHCANYLPLHPLFPAAFDYLKQFDPTTPDGKYEIDGKRLFALVQRYETAPEAAKSWEAHRLYADIQYIASGREIIYHAPVEELQTSIPYNDAKDMEKFSSEGVRSVSVGVIPAGSFGIYLPQDGHKPSCMVEGSEPVVKVVIKVQL